MASKLETVAAKYRDAIAARDAAELARDAARQRSKDAGLAFKKARAACVFAEQEVSNAIMLVLRVAAGDNE